MLLDLWPLLVAMVLLAPMYTSTGHLLARDLVFVPHQPWTDAGLGLGATAPRAVPLDAWVSAITAVVDGGVVARVVLPLLLAAAGWGVHRLLPSAGTFARLVAGGFAVWNPFVVERLALGQWALLAGYAALPWIAAAAVRWRRDGRRRDFAAGVLWLALASLTPTGGLLGLATALTFALARTPRALLLPAVGLLLQLPWLLPGLLGAATTTSDPAGVDAFAARGEGPLPGWWDTLSAVLGLGGIWDAASVPASRESWWGVAATVVVLVALVVGARALRREWGPDAVRAGALAAGGVFLALLSSIGPGADLVRWAVAELPGAGLLRDAQKYAAPAAVLLACGLGAATDLVLRRARRLGVEVAGPLAAVSLVLPVLLLPDAATVTWSTVEPVRFPDAVDEIAEAVAADPADVAVLPWRSYRRFDWGNGRLSSDPAVRFLDADVVVDDTLVVGATEVAGESVRARQVSAALERGRPAEVLPAEGIGWVLVWSDDPAADELDLSGLEPVVSADEVLLLRVPGTLAAVDEPSRTARWIILAADLLAALLVVAAALTRVASRNRKSHRSG